MSKEKKLVAPSYEELANLTSGKVLTVSTGGKINHFFFLQEPLVGTVTGFRGRVRETSQQSTKYITILPGGVVVV